MYRLLTIAALICTARAIFNGADTSIDRVPYQASIIEEGHGYLCAASIISKEFVLTAAHCFDRRPRPYSVRVGSTFLDRGGNVHRVTKIIRHEGYHQGSREIDSYHNDVALLKLTPPIEFDGRTKSPIEIYNTSDLVNYGDVGLVAGCGADQTPDMKAFPGLSSVDLTVVGFSKCLDDYKRYGTVEAPTNNFCAEHPANIKNICSGDAGSAFVIDGKQAGIVSWGWTWDECVESRSAGVYVGVAKYHDWIAEHAGLPSKSEDE